MNCALCYFLPGRVAEAVTMIAGYAVCATHTEFMEDSTLSRAIQLVRAAES